MGSKDYYRCIAGGYRHSEISAVKVFASPLTRLERRVSLGSRWATRTASARLEVVQPLEFGGEVYVRSKCIGQLFYQAFVAKRQLGRTRR